MSAVLEEYALEVSRGPDCLFVTLLCDPRTRPDWSTLTERLQRTLEQHFTYRLVLDLNQSPRVTSRQMGQLLALQKWVHGRGGMMRLCGLSPEVESLLRICRLDRLFGVYRDCQDAVLGRSGPRQPR